MAKPQFFKLFIEEPTRQLECTCRCKMTKHGPMLVIAGVRNATTKEIITDKSLHPDPQIVTAAAELYNWHHDHQAVFKLIVCPD